MRYLVIGTSGAGKSTFAKKMAVQTQCPYIELDSYYWGPGWQAVAPEQFKRCVVEATQGTRWIADGNYSAVREVLWSRPRMLCGSTTANLRYFLACSGALSAMASLASACRTETVSRCAWRSFPKTRYFCGHCLAMQKTSQSLRLCASMKIFCISSG